MWATILEILKDFLTAIPIIAKYFPPKSTEQKVDEGKVDVDQKVAQEESTGRPS